MPSLFTIPGAPAELQARINATRARFAGYTMQAEGDPPAQSVTEDGEEYAFPPNTALDAMTEPQRTEYWRHKARKHEKRVKSFTDYDQLKADSQELARLKAEKQTPDEQASQQAREDLRKELAAELRAEFAPRMVAAEFKTRAGRRLTDKQLTTLLQRLNAQDFLTESGEADGDAIKAFLDDITPAHSPDMGQGNRGGYQAAKADAGKAEALKRFPELNRKD